MNKNNLQALGPSGILKPEANLSILNHFKVSWAFSYSRLVSISGGEITGYFSPEMSVEEMYLASSR